jgi:hypothetical protein
MVTFMPRLRLWGNISKMELVQKMRQYLLLYILVKGALVLCALHALKGLFKIRNMSRLSRTKL